MPVRLFIVLVIPAKCCNSVDTKVLHKPTLSQKLQYLRQKTKQQQNNQAVVGKLDQPTNPTFFGPVVVKYNQTIIDVFGLKAAFKMHALNYADV